MQYSYVDGNLYYFMDNETFEQIPVDSEDVGDSLKFVKEGTDVTLKSYQGKVFAIDPPTTVELLITESEPGVKVTQQQVLQNRLSLRLVRRLWFLCSLMRERSSRLIHVPASIFQEHKFKENIRKINDKSLAFFAGLFYNSNTIIFETQKLLLSEERRYMDYKQFLETVEKK